MPGRGTLIQRLLAVRIEIPLKLVALFVGIQVGLCFGLALATYLLDPHAEFLGGLIILAYLPTIYAIGALGVFKGYTNMGLALFLGVPLGMLLYALIFSFLFRRFKRNKL